ncbi:MAG: endonuclease/exonuclease/phosphatase family protein [Pseudohongiellaceae bacterium]
MREFKILTLNIHKGFSMGNRRFTLERIRENLRETGSNLVFLQEVIGENERHREAITDWPDTNQFEFLADTVWDHYAYGKNAIYQHGHHGNAILSELPFTDFCNVDISTMSFSQRGILHGQIENRVHLLCAHLGLFESERREQIRRLTNYMETNIPASDPLILAGDFNDWRRTAHRIIKRQCGLIEASEVINQRLPATYPAMMPMLPMDRIYLRGFRVESTRVLTGPTWRQVSDHCAIVANVVLD